MKESWLAPKSVEGRHLSELKEEIPPPPPHDFKVFVGAWHWDRTSIRNTIRPLGPRFEVVHRFIDYFTSKELYFGTVEGVVFLVFCVLVCVGFVLLFLMFCSIYNHVPILLLWVHAAQGEPQSVATPGAPQRRVRRTNGL